MSRSIIATALLIASVASAEPAHPRHRTAHLVGIGVALTLDVLGDTVAKDALAADACRWCDPPSLDASIRSHLIWRHTDTANTLSNVTGYGLSPLAAAGLLFAASSSKPDHWQDFADDMIAVTEAAAYTQLAVHAIKFSVGRQRPFVHAAPASRSPGSEDNLSFLSGHTALGFSIAVAAGSVAQRRHSKLAPAIWAVGLGLAATTGYLRIAADKHYFTDVVAGGALGAAGGFLIPRITGALPDDLTIVPSPSGVAILGTF